MLVRDEKDKDSICLLLALKMEEKGREARNVAASEDENDPRSFYRQQENRDYGPTTSRD